jgi:hypothetical protein
MARHVGVSKATVQRVWASHDIKPHRTRIFKLSCDEQFEAKFWDVVGVYADPPDNAVVPAAMRKVSVRRCSAVNPDKRRFPKESVFKERVKLARPKSADEVSLLICINRSSVRTRLPASSGRINSKNGEFRPVIGG